MFEPGSRRTSRLAITFMVVGLALSAAAIVYNNSLIAPQELPPVGPLDEERRATIDAVTATLLVTFAVFLAFLIGSYLMIRFGRLLLDRSPPARTEYIDAWSRYRVSDAEIAAVSDDLKAMSGDDPGSPPKPPPTDEK